MLDDVTGAALRSALAGLAQRQRVIADNVANIQTPNFLARRVMFEDALADAVRSGTGTVAATEARSLEPTQLNGNNVNLDHETLANIDTNLRYQLMLRAVDHKLSVVRESLRSA